MPHSPLFQRLVHALREVRRSRVERVQEPESMFSRRQLLQAGLALSAGVALAGCSTSESERGPYALRDESIIVVGAGIAGLHCAYRLRQAGIIAPVYEASDRVGGRMWSDRATFPGLVCERGGEFIDTGHATMHDLAAELGIALTDFDNDDPDLIGTTAYFDNALISEAAILAAFTPLVPMIDAAVEEADTDAGFERLDALSLSEWLDEIGASGPIRKLLEVAYVIEYGLDADESNCLNLIYLIGTDTEEFHIFGDSDERFHATEGNDQFPTRLAAGLAEGQLTTGARLVALDRRADGRTRCYFERPGASTLVVSAEHVVLAIPFTVLRQVENFLAFPPEKLAAINELGYGQNVKYMVGFDGRPWRAAGASGESYTDLGYQNTWDSSRLQSGTAGILTNYTGGATAVAMNQGTEESRLAGFLAQLAQVYPTAASASTGTTLLQYWPGNPLTLGSYSAYKPGQFSSISGLEIERFENVHFCGEHCSVDFQGYMEGGALTGAMAADEILSDLGRSGSAWVSDGPAARIMARARQARLRGSRRHR